MSDRVVWFYSIIQRQDLHCRGYYPETGRIWGIEPDSIDKFLWSQSQET